jgi:hypothetical protein
MRFVAQGNTLVAMRGLGRERVLFRDVTKGAALPTVERLHRATRRMGISGSVLCFMGGVTLTNTGAKSTAKQSRGVGRISADALYNQLRDSCPQP